MNFWTHRFSDIDARLARIERLLLLSLRAQQREVDVIMALKATDQKLIDEIHRTTNVAMAAVKAINALQATNADLAQKLADAIADSPAADDPAVNAALTELVASNDAVTAATPALAVAIANTNPTAPPPVVREPAPATPPATPSEPTVGPVA